MTTVQIVIIAAVCVFGLLYWVRRTANVKARSRNR
jgi:hypothetical protein